MNKRILAVIVALAVIVIAAVSIVAAQNPNDTVESTATDSSSQSSGDASGSDSDSAEVATIENDGGGSYVDYSPTAIADADGRIILFFHASWCPQCVAAESDIIASGVPSGITFVKVDYDSNQDLRAEYDVTQQTSFVEVDSSGAKLQENFVAYADPSVNAVLTALG